MLISKLTKMVALIKKKTFVATLAMTFVRNYEEHGDCAPVIPFLDTVYERHVPLLVPYILFRVLLINLKRYACFIHNKA